jgi:polar amino acid transport system permease protein
LRKKPTKISPLDILVILLIALLAGYIAWRLTIKLNYKWNWQIIPTYLFRRDADGGWTANLLLEGLFTTLRLSVWSTLLAAALGWIMGIMRTTRRLFNRLVGRTYVELIRNMPPLVLIFIFYFFVSDQIMPLLGVEEFIRSRSPETQAWLAALFAAPNRFTAFVSGVVTIAVFQGAYITEIVRAGIQGIERGQWEAAEALGFTWLQKMRYIILPQAVKQVLPPLANEFINTIKYSSIASVISIQELTFQGLQIMAATHRTIEVWLTITAMYLVICLLLSLAVHRLERRMARNSE